MATNVRDPRSIITPDAFHVSEELLGTPLAPPWRRFWALVIDVVVIAFLSVVTDSISLFIWGAVGLFLISMAFRTPAKGRGQTTGMLFRGATGCLGVGILSIALLVGVGSAFVSNLAEDSGIAPPEEALRDLESGDLSGLADLGPLAGVLEWGGRAALGSATDTTDAREAAKVLLMATSPAELTRDDQRTLLEGATPADAAWRDDAEVVYARAIDEVAAEMAAQEAPPAADVRLDEGIVDSLRTQVAALGDEELLATWLEVLRSREAQAEAETAGDTTEAAPAEIDPAEAAALLVEAARRRIVQAEVVQRFAADTVATLSQALLQARRDEARSDERITELEEELEESQGGFLALMSDIWDQLASAFGLWSIYFTVALTLTRGRTVGKKLLGLRVLRLDGEPLTWWASFERAGGYAAGIATGTMGFVQVFWDANRQCVHDKIGGTVVVQDGADPVPGAWEQAWKEHDANPVRPQAD